MHFHNPPASSAIPRFKSKNHIRTGVDFPSVRGALALLHRDLPTVLLPRAHVLGRVGRSAEACTETSVAHCNPQIFISSPHLIQGKISAHNVYVLTHTHRTIALTDGWDMHVMHSHSPILTVLVELSSQTNSLSVNYEEVTPDSSSPDMSLT